MEQLSDHKPMTPTDLGLLVYGAGASPSSHLGVLFGPQNAPKLKVSMN